jgi:hypothetical protein
MIAAIMSYRHTRLPQSAGSSHKSRTRELSKAMAAGGRVLFEESVAGDLIGDLSRQPPNQWW